MTVRASWSCSTVHQPTKPNLRTVDKWQVRGHSCGWVLPTYRAKRGKMVWKSHQVLSLGKGPSQPKEGLNHYHRERVSVCRRRGQCRKPHRQQEGQATWLGTLRGRKNQGRPCGCRARAPSPRTLIPVVSGPLSPRWAVIHA